MESTAEMNSSAMEQKPMDAIGSTENMPDRNVSLECAASSLVKVSGSRQHHMATASSHSGNDDNQIEMDIGESIEKPLKEKQLQLMDVNDDCLRAIFKQLPILDLVPVADVCKRFRSIAQENFWLAKPIVNIPLSVCRRKYKYAWNVESDEWSGIIQKASPLFRNFGSLMTSLEFEADYREVQQIDRIIVLIIKYCGQNLTALKLHMNEMGRLPIGLKPIIQKLKEVDFKSFQGIDASIAEWLTVVEDLTLQSMTQEPWDALLKRSFKNLRRIRFSQITEIDCRDLAMFLDKHNTITDIYIDYYMRSSSSYKMKIPAQIENLELEIGGTSFDCIERSLFRNLKNLKSLQLHNAEREPNLFTAIIREIVAGDIQLKHLTLKNVSLEMSSEFRELGGALSKLVHLDTLTLKKPWFDDVDEIERLSPMLQRVTELHLENDLRQDEMFTIDEMITIVSYLHNLQRLKVSVSCDEFEVSSIFDTKAFENVVTIVQNRKNNTRLDIELHRCYELKFSNDLAQQHRHILSVRELK